jgi:hypothetical protein
MRIQIYRKIATNCNWPMVEMDTRFLHIEEFKIRTCHIILFFITLPKFLDMFGHCNRARML